MLSSLKLRFACGAFIVLALLMTAGGVFIYLWTEQRLYQERKDTLTLTAQSAASQASLERDFLELYHYKLKQFEENSDVLLLQMLNRQGGIIYGPKEEFEGIQYQPTSSSSKQFANIKIREEEALLLTLNFQPLNEYQGLSASTAPYYASVIVATSLSSLNATLSDLKKIIIIATLSCAIIGAALFAFLAYYSIRPIDNLAKEIQAIDHQAMGPSVNVPRLPSEVLPVVSEFNNLIEKLKVAFDRERTFTSNVSHELRTPLTGLRTTLEVTLAGQKSFESNRDAQETCLTIVKQTQNLVEKLLSLTRLESGKLTHHSEVIELDEYTEGVLDTFREIAESRNIHIILNIPESTEITAPPDLFTVLLNNLIENAVNYCDDNGQIQVIYHEHDSGWKLLIENTGCTLSPEEVSLTFEPFWRHDKARAATGTHAGLGMSIAKAMAENCQLKLKVHVEGEKFQAWIST